jgi:hypothetical protein
MLSSFKYRSQNWRTTFCFTQHLLLCRRSTKRTTLKKWRGKGEILENKGCNTIPWRHNRPSEILCQAITDDSTVLRQFPASFVLEGWLKEIFSFNKSYNTAGLPEKKKNCSSSPQQSLLSTRTENSLYFSSKKQKREGVCTKYLLKLNIYSAIHTSVPTGALNSW